MSMFSHKRSRSMTYMSYSKSSKSWFFKTNISSLSPVFAKFLENREIIKKKTDSITTGYLKNLPRPLIKNLANKEVLFQGIMDGDGSYNISPEHSIYINLALNPFIKYDFIDELPIIPISALDMNKKYVAYEKYKGLPLREIRFAPSSLSSLPKKYSATDIVNQFEFMLKAAENSIRPDKVHSLVAIIKRISSKEYGEYRSCLEIQKQIRDEARKRNLIKSAKSLEKRFPILNGFYKPFIPKWTENLISKPELEESWNSFAIGDFSEKNNYPKPKILDFSNGVPVDFDMTLNARN